MFLLEEEDSKVVDICHFSAQVEASKEAVKAVVELLDLLLKW